MVKSVAEPAARPQLNASHEGISPAASDGLRVSSAWLQAAAADDALATWYPPVERTLACLSKLYRCVDAGIFAGLAQEAVAAAADAVHIGRRGVARRSSALDGMLFLVRHLLVLREQVSFAA